MRLTDIPRWEHLRERFWAKVEKTDGCWLWRGSVGSPQGYGMVSVGSPPSRVMVRAHRVAYALANGDVPDGLCVCHSCDNRLCVNPAHLFIGTASDNFRDMWAKGRQGRPNRKGTANGNARLSPGDVALIRREYGPGATQQDLAARFGVSQVTISKIVRHETWTEEF